MCLGRSRSKINCQAPTSSLNTPIYQQTISIRQFGLSKAQMKSPPFSQLIVLLAFVIFFRECVAKYNCQMNNRITLRTFVSRTNTCQCISPVIYILTRVGGNQIWASDHIDAFLTSSLGKYLNGTFCCIMVIRMWMMLSWKFLYMDTAWDSKVKNNCHWDIQWNHAFVMVAYAFSTINYRVFPCHLSMPCSLCRHPAARGSLDCNSRKCWLYKFCQGGLPAPSISISSHSNSHLPS